MATCEIFGAFKKKVSRGGYIKSDTVNVAMSWTYVQSYENASSLLKFKTNTTSVTEVVEKKYG
jgi:hypothetical protein